MSIKFYFAIQSSKSWTWLELFVLLLQELASLEEKLEYQMDERMRDLQDVVDACQTKV